MSIAAKKGNPIDAIVGARVRLRRMGLGMSQGLLGEKLGVTFQQVQKYERGTNRIGAGRLQEIARALGVPIGFFFDDASKTPAGDAGDVAGYLSAEGIRLNRAFMKIGDVRLRQRVVDVVRSIADAGDKGPQ